VDPSNLPPSLAPTTRAREELRGENLRAAGRGAPRAGFPRARRSAATPHQGPRTPTSAASGRGARLIPHNWGDSTVPSPRLGTTSARTPKFLGRGQSRRSPVSRRYSARSLSPRSFRTGIENERLSGGRLGSGSKAPPRVRGLPAAQSTRPIRSPMRPCLRQGTTQTSQYDRRVRNRFSRCGPPQSANLYRSRHLKSEVWKVGAHVSIRPVAQPNATAGICRGHAGGTTWSSMQTAGFVYSAETSSACAAVGCHRARSLAHVYAFALFIMMVSRLPSMRLKASRFRVSRRTSDVALIVHWRTPTDALSKASSPK